jgi:hypothetical protein
MSARKPYSKPNPDILKDRLHEERPRPDEHPDELEEDSLDRTIEDSFPASDPPSSIPDPDEDAA